MFRVGTNKLCWEVEGWYTWEVEGWRKGSWRLAWEVVLALDPTRNRFAFNGWEGKGAIFRNPLGWKKTTRWRGLMGWCFVLFFVETCGIWYLCLIKGTWLVAQKLRKGRVSWRVQVHIGIISWPGIVKRRFTVPETNSKSAWKIGWRITWFSRHVHFSEKVNIFSRFFRMNHECRFKRTWVLAVKIHQRQLCGYGSMICVFFLFGSPYWGINFESFMDFNFGTQEHMKNAGFKPWKDGLEPPDKLFPLGLSISFVFVRCCIFRSVFSRSTGFVHQTLESNQFHKIDRKPRKAMFSPLRLLSQKIHKTLRTTSHQQHNTEAYCRPCTKRCFVEMWVTSRHVLNKTWTTFL